MDRVEEMKHLRFVEMWSLERIAIKYGISRERVRQLIGNSGRIVKAGRLKVYDQNKHLSNAALSGLMGISKRGLQQCYQQRGRHDVDGGNAEVGYAAENIVSSKLLSLGFLNTLMPYAHSFDILLSGGVRVDVKSSHPMNKSKTASSLYNFNTGTYRKGSYCDFLILVLLDTRDFFVVPVGEAKGIIRFCWPGKSSKWLKYHNRFDLLKGVKSDGG